ncbi:MAG: hypothetical protein KKB65_08465 [Nanoarchaeota archaeon]|nr:hypothetical protein [Nanoarchaeota archaeon]
MASPYVLNNLFFIFVDFCLSFFGFSSVVTFLFVDAFCGVLYVYVSFLLSGRLFSGERKFLFFLMFLAIGSFKIFFGDIEVYAPVVVLLLVYVFFSIEYLLGRKSVLFPGFSFVFLFLFHVHVIFFLPTLVILPFLKKRFCSRKVFVLKELSLLFKIFVLPVLFFVILFSPKLFEFDNKFIYPSEIYPLEDFGFNSSQGFISFNSRICPYCFCEKPLFCGSPELSILTLVKQNNVIVKQYNLFDFSHIKDWFNIIILIGPVFFLMLFVLFRVIQNLYLKFFYKDILLIFFSFCLLSLLFRTFILNFTTIELDWDALVLFGPIISLWTGYVCLKYFRFDKDLLIYVFWSLFAIGVCVVRDVLFII